MGTHPIFESDFDCLTGDENIVNCVQPNKYVSYIATSGIDNEIRIWAPTDPDKADAFTLNTDPTFFVERSDENQRQLSGPSYFEQNLFPLLMSRFLAHEF